MRFSFKGLDMVLTRLLSNVSEKGEGLSGVLQQNWQLFHPSFFLTRRVRFHTNLCWSTHLISHRASVVKDLHLIGHCDQDLAGDGKLRHCATDPGGL
jgi:hypothetical protein